MIYLSLFSLPGRTDTKVQWIPLEGAPTRFHLINGAGRAYDGDRLLAGRSCGAERHGRVSGPGEWRRRRRGGPDLWSQNSSRIPRLEIDLRGSRRRQQQRSSRVLGNDVAIKAYREGKLPFPDGAIIARLAWSYVPSEENNKVFGRAQSFVAGGPINVQVMVKDSRKYTTTGGWGFAQFKDGKPADEAVHNTCFPCHQSIKAGDLVFTHYSP